MEQLRSIVDLAWANGSKHARTTLMHRSSIDARPVINRNNSLFLRIVLPGGFNGNVAHAHGSPGKAEPGRCVLEVMVARKLTGLA